MPLRDILEIKIKTNYLRYNKNRRATLWRHFRIRMREIVHDTPELIMHGIPEIKFKANHLPMVNDDRARIVRDLIKTILSNFTKPNWYSDTRVRIELWMPLHDILEIKIKINHSRHFRVN